MMMGAARGYDRLQCVDLISGRADRLSDGLLHIGGYWRSDIDKRGISNL